MVRNNTVCLSPSPLANLGLAALGVVDKGLTIEWDRNLRKKPSVLLYMRNNQDSFQRTMNREDRGSLAVMSGPTILCKAWPIVLIGEKSFVNSAAN
jgi:hypothetical protein